MAPFCPTEDYSPCTCDEFYSFGQIDLNCNGKNMTDQMANRVLDIFLNATGRTSPIARLGIYENNLTRVTEQIAKLQTGELKKCFWTKYESQ